MNSELHSRDRYSTSDAVSAQTCAETDSIWVGIERCLDNGRGRVLVCDARGAIVGQAALADLRQHVRDGSYTSNLVMGSVMTRLVSAPPSTVSALVFDGAESDAGRIAAFLPVAEPDLTHAELRNAMDAFLSTWISSSGSYLGDFERRFAEIAGATHAVAVSNGTVALNLALAALGIGEGDEVIVPDFTFPATANAVIHAGARPVLVDLDPDTWCISVQTIERAITPRTRAIIPVHIFGRPAPMTEIVALAREHGLFVIEDCAEAPTARYDGQPTGSFSDIATFSFFANKIITTGEGGMCTTSDPELAARMRQLRDHGMRPDRRYWFDQNGFNFRMTNIQAAIGCAQLDRLPDLLAMRRRVDSLYKAAFAGCEAVTMPAPLSDRFEPVVWFSCALMPAEHRTKAMAACLEANIDLRPFFNSLSAMPAFRRYARVCPQSARLAASGINLPTSRRVTPELAQRVADIVIDTIRKS